MSVKTVSTAGKIYMYKCTAKGFQDPSSPGTAESDTYKVIVKNQSSKAWTFFLFQRPPEDATDAQSLVWMATPFNIDVGGQYTFSWTATYQFVWADTGLLEPEVILNAGGFKDADPKDNNLTNFTVKNNTPSLSDSTTGGPTGSLVIEDGPNVPSNKFSVGLAMFNKAIYALNAGPSLTHIFTPSEQPSYYVCASDAVTEGEVLFTPGFSLVTLSGVKELIFPTNVFALTATFTNANTWEIQPSWSETQTSTQTHKICIVS